MTAGFVLGSLGARARVDIDRVVAAISDGTFASQLSDTLTARLRLIADEIDSEVLALREAREGMAERAHSETEFLEGTVPEVGQFGVVHDADSRIGVIGRILGVLFHRPRKSVSGHGAEPTDDCARCAGARGRQGAWIAERAA